MPFHKFALDIQTHLTNTFKNELIKYLNNVLTKSVRYIEDLT